MQEIISIGNAGCVGSLAKLPRMSWLPLVLGLVWLSFALCALAFFKGRARTASTPQVKLAVTLVASVLFAGVAVFGVSQFGLLNGGREKKTSTFSGFSGSSRGYSFGSKQVYARAGQSLEVDYAIVSGQGSISLWVKARPGVMGISNFNDAPLWRRSLKAVGRFKESVPLPTAGLYNFHVTVYPDKGSRLVHEVTWKVK